MPEVVKGPAENGTKPEPVPDPVDGDKGFIPPVPTKDEARRLKLLRALNILDTDKEDRFSSITTLMCTVFNVPIAAVSLVDEDKSRN